MQTMTCSGSGLPKNECSGSGLPKEGMGRLVGRSSGRLVEEMSTGTAVAVLSPATAI